VESNPPSPRHVDVDVSSDSAAGILWDQDMDETPKTHGRDIRINTDSALPEPVDMDMLIRSLDNDNEVDQVTGPGILSQVDADTPMDTLEEETGSKTDNPALNLPDVNMDMTFDYDVQTPGPADLDMSLASGFENPNHDPVDISHGLVAANAIREGLLLGSFDTSYIPTLQCEGRPAFISPRAALNFAYILFLKWILKPYNPSTNPEDFINDTFLLLLTLSVKRRPTATPEEPQKPIMLPLFTEAAARHLRQPDHDALKVLALVLNDAYTKSWADWVTHPHPRTAGNWVGVYQRAAHFCGELSHASEEIQDWAEKVYWESPSHGLVPLNEDEEEDEPGVKTYFMVVAKQEIAGDAGDGEEMQVANEGDDEEAVDDTAMFLKQFQ